MITLRKAALADAALLVGWRNAGREHFGDTSPLTLASHRRWWHEVYEQDPWDHLYVAEAAGRPAGTVGMYLGGGLPEIHRVLLGDKALARTGVMSAALTVLMDAYGLPRYRLRVRRGNTAAIRFYGRNGFTVTGTGGEFWVMTR